MDVILMAPTGPGPAGPMIVPGPYCFGGDVAICDGFRYLPGIGTRAAETCRAVANGACLILGLVAFVAIGLLGLWMVIS